MDARAFVLGLLKHARLSKVARRGDTLLHRDDVLTKLSSLHSKKKPRRT